MPACTRDSVQHRAFELRGRPPCFCLLHHQAEPAAASCRTLLHESIIPLRRREEAAPESRPLELSYKPNKPTNPSRHQVHRKQANTAGCAPSRSDRSCSHLLDVLDSFLDVVPDVAHQLVEPRLLLRSRGTWETKRRKRERRRQQQAKHKHAT